MSQYKLYNDGDGHEYLIPYGIWSLFCAKISDLEDLANEGNSEPLSNYLESFEQLDGREYVVFLEDDLKKGYK